METWSKGRVILIGVAACAVSLLAGEGTGIAITQAYVLAGELERARGDYRAAFSNYENRMRAFVEGKQIAAENFASSFLPETAVWLWLRNQMTRLMRLPGIADWLIGRSVLVGDDFDLPNYSM
jgi:2-polyprenyl-6-methoxyphenol hydroxylase-like FAD-dependent oxidoreductase